MADEPSFLLQQPWPFAIGCAFLLGLLQLGWGLTDIKGAIISRWIGGILVAGSLLACCIGAWLL